MTISETRMGQLRYTEFMTLPYLFVGIDRTSKFAVTQLVEKADRRTAWEFLQHIPEAVPYQVHIFSPIEPSEAPLVQAQWRGAFSSLSSLETATRSIPGQCVLTGSVKPMGPGIG